MMKFETFKLYNVAVEFDEYRERKEILKFNKDIQLKLLTRTTNQIDEGFKGLFPKLNGFTYDKNIKQGDILERNGVKYRVIYVDPIPRLTTLYIELM